MSSSGMNPPGIDFPRIPIATIIMTTNITPLVSLRATMRVNPRYEAVDLSKALLNNLKKAPNGPRYGFRFLSSSEHRAGLSVNALTEEKHTETATVTANC